MLITLQGGSWDSWQRPWTNLDSSRTRLLVYTLYMKYSLTSCGKVGLHFRWSEARNKRSVLKSLMMSASFVQEALELFNDDLNEQSKYHWLECRSLGAHFPAYVFHSLHNAPNLLQRLLLTVFIFFTFLGVILPQYYWRNNTSYHIISYIVCSNKWKL